MSDNLLIFPTGIRVWFLFGLALMFPALVEAQGAQWPFPGRLELRQCGTGKVIPPDDAFYKHVATKVITGLTQGLYCLKQNPNTPQRAKNLDKLLQSGGTLRLFFHCSAQDMYDPDDTACGASRAVPFAGQLVQFHDRALDPAKCGCLEGTVFHEMIHVTSSSIECPAYRCAKECFACARPVPDECANYKTCCDPGRVCCTP